MRKGATRGLINRTFINYKGTASIFDKASGKKKNHKFDFSIDVNSDNKAVEDLLQDQIKVSGLIVLSINDCSKQELVYSMSKEDFLKYAKVL